MSAVGSRATATDPRCRVAIQTDISVFDSSSSSSHSGPDHSTNSVIRHDTKAAGSIQGRKKRATIGTTCRFASVCGTFVGIQQRSKDHVKEALPIAALCTMSALSGPCPPGKISHSKPTTAALWLQSTPVNTFPVPSWPKRAEQHRTRIPSCKGRGKSLGDVLTARWTSHKRSVSTSPLPDTKQKT